jgi:hypothetical protein
MPLELSKLKVKVTTKPIPPLEKIFSWKQLQLIDSEMRDEEWLKEYLEQYYLWEFQVDKIEIIEAEEETDLTDELESATCLEDQMDILLSK